MTYCNKCGKEISEGSHCPDCKIENLNQKVEKHKKNNFLVWGFAILIIIMAMFFVFKTGNVVKEEHMKECPYECCKEASGFIINPCPNLYSCLENKCVAIDSDSDGLTDIKENEIGTNPKNPNTDGDRYKDNIDPSPLNPNSAKIKIVFTSKSWDWKYGNIILAVVGGAVINPDLIIAEPKTSIEVKNIGDDYTTFVDFNIIFDISNTMVSQRNVHLNKFDVGERYQETYIQEITAGNIPDLVINLVKQQTSDWGIEIQNLNYETFS